MAPIARHLPQKDLATLLTIARSELEQRDDKMLARLVHGHGRKKLAVRYPKLSVALNREYAVAARGIIKRINNGWPLQTAQEKAFAQILLRLSPIQLSKMHLMDLRNGPLGIYWRRRLKRLGKHIAATVCSLVTRLKK